MRLRPCFSVWKSQTEHGPFRLWRKKAIKDKHTGIFDIVLKISILIKRKSYLKRNVSLCHIRWMSFVFVVVQLLSQVWLCDPMDCSTPGSSVLRCLEEFADSYPLNHWCSRLCLLCHQSFPASGSFPVSQLFTSCSQSNGALASALVLPMNIQGWFPLELTGFISLRSKDSQESSPVPEFKSICSSALSLLYGPTLTCTWLLEKP